VRPTGQRPLQSLDLEKVDADAAHPDGDSIRPVARFATCAGSLGSATVSLPEAKAQAHGRKRERMAPKDFPSGMGAWPYG
jgi:hypothetical protein